MLTLQSNAQDALFSYRENKPHHSVTLNPHTLKGVPDMIRTYSHMHRTDKYSQQSSTFGRFS